MLKPAYLYSDQLQRKYAETIDDNYYNFYFTGMWRNYKLKVYDDDCWIIQRVSVNSKGDVIGYMSASFDRESRVASSFAIMNFTKHINAVFAKDLLSYIRYLRDVQKASKFEFCAFVGGNPDRMYKQFIKKHGGRIIGVSQDATVLRDGLLHDMTLFEIMRLDMNF